MVFRYSSWPKLIIFQGFCGFSGCWALDMPLFCKITSWKPTVTALCKTQCRKSWSSGGRDLDKFAKCHALHFTCKYYCNWAIAIMKMLLVIYWHDCHKSDQTRPIEKFCHFSQIDVLVWQLLASISPYFSSLKSTTGWKCITMPFERNK